MSWYRIYGDTGATFDIWDYGHEIMQVPTQQLYQYIGLYDPDGKRKGYISGVIYDDISHKGTDVNPVPMPDGTKAPAKRLVLSQVFTSSAQQEIKGYYRTAVKQPKLFVTTISDKKNGVIYQIYAASRTEAEEIKSAFNAYGIDNIMFVRKGMNINNNYKALFLIIGWETVVVLLVLFASMAAMTYFITSTFKAYFHAKEVISYYEVEKKAIEQKIESLKLQGKVLDFLSLAGVEETETSYIYYYNDGTIVEVDKKTGKTTVTHESNMTPEMWGDWWVNFTENNKTPDIPTPPSIYTEILKWIAIIAGISIGGYIIYKYVSSGKASEHASKAKETISAAAEKLKSEIERK